MRHIVKELDANRFFTAIIKEANMFISNKFTAPIINDTWED